MAKKSKLETPETNNTVSEEQVEILVEKTSTEEVSLEEESSITSTPFVIVHGLAN